MNKKLICRQMVAATSLLVGLAALSGCGKDLKQSVEEPQLMKAWEGKCSTADLIGLPAKSVKQFYKFAGSEYKEVHTFYTEANCVGESVDLTYRGEVTLKTKEEGQSARKVDFRFDNVEVTALNAKGKQTLEGIRFCGNNVYELGKTISLNGKTGGLGCPLRVVPSGEFNIFAIDGDKLFLGKAGLRGGPKKETDRPTTVDRDQPFTATGRNL